MVNPIARLLIANRGEIAVRIARTAREMGIETVAVHAEDDAASLHVLEADRAAALPGSGAAAYLDMDAVLALARDHGCDALHPGYGFHSESAELARSTRAAGIVFVGPRVEVLELCGDKSAARRAAADAGVPVLPGTDGPTSVDQAGAFLESLAGAGMVVKAIGGGGGRGMRVVAHADELPVAFERAASEARSAFGNGALYVEALLPRARHVEVQIVGDGTRVSHLGERDCSLQRRHQKLVEIAPAPNLPDSARERILDAALRLAAAIGYDNVGTFEFLIETGADDAAFFFIEANARLQVEHTVTEAVTGIDLVATQLAIAGGADLKSLGLSVPAAHAPRGCAIEVRVNMERIGADGRVLPSSGRLEAFAPPAGPGVRTDTFGYAGYRTSARYDSLLAKVIGHHGGGFDAARAKTYRALCGFQIEGIETNIDFLANVLTHPAFAAGELYTRFIDDHLEGLAVAGDHPRLHPAAVRVTDGRVGARIDPDDPLGVLSYGQRARDAAPERSAAVEAAGGAVVPAPLQGTIIAIEVAEGDAVQAGQTLVVMESMKMEHEVRASVSGIVRGISVAVGETLAEGEALVQVEPSAHAGAAAMVADDIDLDHIRGDLLEVEARRETTRDAARADAVARRRATGQRTARENIDDLCDPGTFVEYGPLVLAAQRRRRSIEELIGKSPADGMITGVGRINGALFADPDARCAVMSYDYTVFAGTQGGQNHRKTDRLIDVAEQGRMPMVLFAEGGGGRPGDTDGVGGEGQRTFSRFATLSAAVPMVGIVSGRCFAGNASLLGCCDVIIATENTNLGMGGPAMIEGGGLGVFAPEDIGPMSVQVPNGVVDVAVSDEAAAVAAAKKYLAFFQGRLGDWAAPDQRRMRHIVPENRKRVYAVRDVIETLADSGSTLELRPVFGATVVTTLIRVEGRAVGVIANNPTVLGGAIDADGADKAARFMQLCDAFDVPILYLCDTPGIMVGPEVEKTALVRHSSRMFVIGANLSVPFFTIVLRKAYGLGAIAMAGGSYKVPTFTVSWPTGEFGGMGLEGSVKLGYRNELAAIEDAAERKQRFEDMVARAYAHGKALNQASLFVVDDTIDPADSRRWLSSLLASMRPPAPRTGKKRSAIDAW